MHLPINLANDRSNPFLQNIFENETLQLLLRIFAWYMLVSAWGFSIMSVPKSVGLLLFGATFIPALLFFWFKPEYGLITYLFIVAGFFQYNFIEIAKIEARDFLLFSLIGINVLKALIDKDLRIAWWPNGGLLALFLFMAGFSILYALFYVKSETNWILGEARIVIGYSVYFLVTWSINDKRAFRVLLFGSLMIGTLLCSIIIIQQFYGVDRLFLPTMTLPGWHVWDEGRFVRVVAPTMIHIFLMCMLSFGITLKELLTGGAYWVWGINTAINAIGLLLTFTRSAWISSAICILLIFVFLFPYYRQYLAKIVIFGTCIALFLVGGLGTLTQYSEISIPFFSDIVDRFTSIFEVEATSNTASLEWRKFEFQEAKKAIKKSPWFGVGLGGSYRTVQVFQGEAQGLFVNRDISYERIYRYTKFLHSGYLQIVVKMGIPTFLLFFFTYLKIIFDSIRSYFQLVEKYKSQLILVVLAIIPSGLLSLLFWAIFHEFFYSIGNTPFLGLALGILGLANTLVDSSQELV